MRKNERIRPLLTPRPGSRTRRLPRYDATLPHKRVVGARELRDGRILSWGGGMLRFWRRDGSLSSECLTSHSLLGAEDVVELNDGRILSWGNYVIQIWGADGQFCLEPWKGMLRYIDGACDLTGGRFIFWGSDGQQAKLCLLSLTGRPEYHFLEGHTGAIEGACELGDGRILSWSEDKTLRLWQADGRPDCGPLSGHSGAIEGACELSDGRLLSWSQDKTLRLWKPDGHPCGDPLEGHSAAISGACELSNGRILSWSEDKTLRIWKKTGQSESTVLDGHRRRVSGACELSDGRILSWAPDWSLRIWHRDGRPQESPLEHQFGVSGALVMTDERVLSWGIHGALRIWKTMPQAESDLLSGHLGQINGARELKDGRILSWSKDDGQLLAWWPAGEPGKAPTEAPVSPVLGVLELIDGRILSWRTDGGLQLAQADGSRNCELVRPDIWAVGGACELSGNRILSWCGEELQIRYLETLRRQAQLEGHKNFVGGACELHDGRLLSWDGGFGNSDSTLRVWRSDGRSAGDPLEGGHQYGIKGACGLSNGEVLSWGFQDEVLRVRSIARWSAYIPLAGHEHAVTGARELRDGRILSWDSGGVLRFWWPDGRSEGDSLKAHSGSIEGACELDDGRILSWSDDEGALKLCNPHQANPIYSWPIRNIKTVSAKNRTVIATELTGLYVLNLTLSSLNYAKTSDP